MAVMLARVEMAGILVHASHVIMIRRPVEVNAYAAADDVCEELKHPEGRNR